MIVPHTALVSVTDKGHNYGKGHYVITANQGRGWDEGTQPEHPTLFSDLRSTVPFLWTGRWY